MFDDSFWQNKEPNIANDSSKIQDQEQVRSYKDNVKSINMIVSKEIEDKAKQIENSIVKNIGAKKHPINYDPYKEQNQLQDDPSSLELSQLQSQVFIPDQANQDIQENYEAHDQIDEFDNIQNNDQNQNDKDKHASMSIDINSDASYSQMWK